MCGGEGHRRGGETQKWTTGNRRRGGQSVQQAVVTVLNAIYEEHFIGFSYVRNGPATGGSGRERARRGPCGGCRVTGIPTAALCFTASEGAVSSLMMPRPRASRPGRGVRHVGAHAFSEFWAWT